ncbi:hypothetical protein ESCO_004776 [Escovopsis weberi]|uniref:Uncharacterized protein n=1 Tax=Escovopsis weberi TaxID=150374 RepID=A0A0M8MU40_ESCWE|nr:hypothetical protein ESCO_004776 [Escovopsis weberi]
MSDKQSSAQVENGSKPQKRGCCGFFKRFWWAILLVLIAIIVLVVCIIIFVAVPKIAQQKVNQAKLEIQGVRLAQASANRFRVDINSTITTDGKIKGDIDAFPGILYLTDAGDEVPFMNVSFPPTTADKFQTVNISQEVEIGDHDAFNRFTTYFFDNETLRVSLEGRTKVKAHGLSKKFGVDFKKTVELKGLNAFKGTTVSGGSILIKPENGANFKAVSHIPNPSVFSLDIGNTTFASNIDGNDIGNLTIQNLFIVPGNNDFPVTANLNQAKIINLVTGPKYCETGDVPVNLQGNSVLNNGEHLRYYELALASESQTVNMNIAAIIKSSLNVTIACLGSKSG